MVRVVAATVALSSLYSRLASFALLAIGARVLTFQEFGVLAVALGAAIAVANTLAVGAGDQIATQAVTNPRSARRFIFRSGSALLAAAVGFSVIALVVRQPPVAILAISISICASTAVCMTTMNFLRGRGWITTGSILAYVAMPTLRTVAVVCVSLVGSATLRSVMMAINVASILSAVVALAFAYQSTRSIDRGSAVNRATARKEAILLGTSLALAWGILSQGDVTALAIFRDAVAAAEYTPTMRLIEALSALTIGIKFALTRHMVMNAGQGLQSRVLIPLSVVFAVGAVSMLLFAPTVLTFTFGEDYTFNYQVAFILAPAYFLSSIVSMLLQILVARRCGSQVAMSTSILIVGAIVLLALGAVTAGATGVAVAVLLTFAAWLAALLAIEVKTRNREEAN